MFVLFVMRSYLIEVRGLKRTGTLYRDNCIGRIL